MQAEKSFIQPALMAQDAKRKQGNEKRIYPFFFFSSLSPVSRANLLSRPCTFASLR